MYEHMLNEAIVQSLMEQTRLENENNQGALPLQETEEQVLKEVLKLSEAEYKRQTGQINLSHLKKKN